MKDALKITFILFAGIFLSAAPYLPANPTTQAMLAAVAKKRGAVPTIIHTEGFDETDSGGALGSSTDGYDMTTVLLESGTFEQDNVEQFGGSQSLKLTASGIVTWTLASNTDLYVKFKMRWNTLPAATQFYVFGFADVALTYQGFIGVNTSGTLYVRNGSTSANTTGAIAADTDYYVWGHWTSAGVMEASFSTTDSRPTSGNNYKLVTGGNGSNSVVRTRFRTTETIDVWIEDAQISTGNYPDE